jgi:hypothetical protein
MKRENKDIIELARIKFNNKEFKKCIALYETVNAELINDLDLKIIAFCKRAIEDADQSGGQNRQSSAS